ncbi:MAG: hypothetical protein KHY83_04965 [Coriobacteriia bacterium]|nr:hypothetical protein [Coriobacteriia bacterium]MBS5477996.1 hypothetical protein [Coriobacteriia bacterium]
MSLFDFQKVTVKPETMVARVRLANDAPVRTSEDLDATNRVYQLMPQIADHTCICDKGDSFRSALGDTELAHLLEHVAIELLVRAGVQDVSVGRTTETDEDRVWDIELTCPDDALTLGVLSSAAWVMEWAFTGGAEPSPDIDHTVAGLRALVDGLSQEAAPVAE